MFRDFINATAQVTISQNEVSARFQKRADNPLLIAAEFDKIDTPIPWIG